jgi:hypothetical protein
VPGPLYDVSWPLPRARAAVGAPEARRLDSCRRAVFTWPQPTGSHDSGRQAVSTSRRLRCPRLPLAGPGWAIAKAAMYTASAGCCHVISAARVACH